MGKFAKVSRIHTTISLRRARLIVAALWLAGAFLVLTLVFLNTLDRHSDSEESKGLWIWGLSWTVPPVTSILTCIGARAFDTEDSKRVVDCYFFGVSLLISSVEIVFLIVILLLEELSPSLHFNVAHFAKVSG